MHVAGCIGPSSSGLLEHVAPTEVVPWSVEVWDIKEEIEAKENMLGTRIRNSDYTVKLVTPRGAEY